MKEEALKLAKIFEEVGRAKYPYHLDAAEMLRRLVEELDKQQAEIDRLNLELGNPIDHEKWGKHQVACKHDVDDGACKECYEEATQTKPLSDEELHKIFRKYFPRTIFSNGFKQFARDAIEKAHEIK